MEKPLTYKIRLEGDPNSLLWPLDGEDHAQLICKINTDEDGNDKYKILCEVYDGDKLIATELLSTLFNGLETAPPTVLKAPKTWPDMNK